MITPLPRTLILDYYDSYTNNLLTLFTKLYSDAEVLDKVVVVKADTYTWSEFQENVLPNIDCVILSPGPGRPDNPADIGFALDLLRLHPIPILGVCLGHQAIGVAFGGKIINTPQITHGHVIPVAPVRPPIGLFASPFWKNGIPSEDQFDVVVYNSLIVDSESLPEQLEVTAWSVPSPKRPSTIQGLKHKEHPIWGVQYHPESISSTNGCALLQSFIGEVNTYHGHKSTYPRLIKDILRSCAYRVASASSRRPSFSSTSGTGTGLPTPPITPSLSPKPFENRTSRQSPLKTVEHSFGNVGKELRTEDVFEAILRQPSRKGKEKAIGEVWLDGQTPTRATTSSLSAPTFALTYSLSTRTVTLHQSTGQSSTLILPEESTFWDWFSEGHEAISKMLSTCTGSSSVWKGGWTGWFAYEMKGEGLQGYNQISSSISGTEEVDACWAWSDRLLQRSPVGEWTARVILREGSVDQQREGNDMLSWLSRCGIEIGATQIEIDEYLASVRNSLSTIEASPGPPTSEIASFPTFRPRATGDDYQRRIDGCREAIRQGESYELTLTTRFEASLPTNTDADTDGYNLYLRLRKFNPAYYSAYMNFPLLETPRGKGLTILSSSPERFLKIDHERKVEMMPIKGTRARVKAGQCVCVVGESQGCGGQNKGSKECQEQAKRVDERIGEELRTDHKERAENLMIVDLIRSDLLSCCMPSTVTVPKLIALESYGVHNLVTTVQGHLAPNVGSVEAVKRCFPPGSMTGAPKLRSVQLLDEFEGHQRRGIYSGALGYFSIDGSADLSVVIRTIIKEGNNLSIGAGGAITWLSNRESEWEEVLTKVKSVVGSLDGVE